MTLTADVCLTHLTSLPAVRAIARCGSYRTGIQDHYSDLDIWVFCDDDTPLSEDLVVRDFLPDAARLEVLFEGRDDTLVEHLVVNVLTGPVVLNLKFLRAGVLTRFCARPPSPDAGYLEDLENYHTMQALHDPAGVLAVHRAWLEQHAVRTVHSWLTPDIIARYSAMYWRSVYQGVLRDETHTWRHLVITMLELLTWHAYLNAGHLPPPRKWLFSRRLLHDVTAGADIDGLLEELHRADDQPAILAFYARLGSLEHHVLGEHPMNHGFWWRAVWTQRLPNLAAVLDLGDLLARVAHAGIAGPQPS